MPRADRLFALVQLLSGAKRIPLRELAQKLDSSERTVYRDLAALEERGIAIERVDGSYRLLDRRAASLPLTPRERLLLEILLESPSLSTQPAYRPLLRSLRSKLAPAGGAENGRPLLAGPERSGEIAGEIVEALEEAIGSSHSVSIRYGSLASGEAWRAVDPWVTVHRAGAWYLVGRCHRHDEPRTFRLDRIRAVLPIGTSFERPKFDVEAWFAASWGVEAPAGGPLHDVAIVFEPAVAPLIESARHHPRELKHRLPDGTLEYRVTLAALDEIARWIVGFGGSAHATAPAALVGKVASMAEGAANAHARPRERAAAMESKAPPPGGAARRRKRPRGD
jgi:predicted DNA-binding transcriptional regulator YafY